MPYKIERDKNKLIEAYNAFVETKEINVNRLDVDFLEIRRFFISTYRKYEMTAKKEYEIDLNVGLDFYEYMNSREQFNSVIECDDVFWKNIAIYVIPDVIASRHNSMNPTYYYSKNLRIYPFVLYWYIKLSWQGNREETYEILKNNSTDEIMQMVERPSTIGINLELNRKIMKKFSEIPQNRKTILINGKLKKVFRLVFLKNTAKLATTRPEIYPGGIDGYVNMLFEDYV